MTYRIGPHNIGISKPIKVRFSMNFFDQPLPYRCVCVWPFNGPKFPPPPSRWIWASTRGSPFWPCSPCSRLPSRLIQWVYDHLLRGRVKNVMYIFFQKCRLFCLYFNSTRDDLGEHFCNSTVAPAVSPKNIHRCLFATESLYCCLVQTSASLDPTGNGEHPCPSEWQAWSESWHKKINLNGQISMAWKVLHTLILH